MQKENVETLGARLERVEKMLETVTLQLAWLVEELVPEAPERCKIEAAYRIYHQEEKRREAEAIQEVMEHFGIAGLEPKSAAEIRASMRKNGIRAEDNEFSRAIIEAREA